MTPPWMLCIELAMCLPFQRYLLDTQSDRDNCSEHRDPENTQIYKYEKYISALTVSI